MDSYSGSEPRLFISFRLGNESNGQPPRRGADDEKMDSNDSFVTAIATTENQLTVNTSNRGSVIGDSGSIVHEEAVEISDDNLQTEATVKDLSDVNLAQNNSQQELGGLLKPRPKPVPLLFLCPALYKLRVAVLMRVVASILPESGDNWAVPQRRGPMVNLTATLKSSVKVQQWNWLPSRAKQA